MKLKLRDFKADPEGRASVDKMRDQIRQLSADEQEILIRSYHLEQPEEEISRDTGITIATIREVKKNARRRFLRKSPLKKETSA